MAEEIFVSACRHSCYSFLAFLTSLYVVAPSTAVSIEIMLFKVWYCRQRFSTESRVSLARKAPLNLSHRWPCLLFFSSFNTDSNSLWQISSIRFVSVVNAALGPNWDSSNEGRFWKAASKSGLRRILVFVSDNTVFRVLSSAMNVFTLSGAFF